MKTSLSSFAAFAVALAIPSLSQAAELFEVKGAAASATVGAKEKTALTLAAKNGWHVNEQAPITVKLAAGPGITLEKAKLSRADLAETTKDKVRFDVSFTASEAGSKTIDAEASFVICQDSACKPVKEKIQVAVDAKAAAAAPVPGAAKPKASKQRKKS